MWQLKKGDIPDGVKVLHSCDNPGCVNPNHLLLGTQQENMDDMVNKGRSLHRHGLANPNARISQEQIEHIKELRQSGMLYGDI